MKKIKVLSAVLALVMLVSCFPFTALAAGEKTVEATYYILNAGLPVPTGTGSQPTANYSKAGKGTITISDGYKGEYSEEGVSNVVTAPEVKLDNGQSIVWYVTKHESDGWHVDGVITPFYTFLYDGRGAEGETTDPTHYFEKDTATVAENKFTKEGYTFEGWNTKADGKGTAYKPGDQIKIKDLGFPKGINTLTLYAIWHKNPATDETTTTEPTKPAGKTTTLSIVTPKKMSVRFEDGKIYKSGDKLTIEIGKEYKFQMCSNDWDTDTYTDDGHGIAGTVVYTVKVSNSYTERSYDAKTKTFVLPKGDRVLRTDVNNCFMAYKFHFNTDYNKQTGIKQVVNTPLESLSVNLPLGSTIKADAYVKMNYKKSDFVFVEKDNEHLNRSYITYKWGF